jgi:hypothetical protein
MIAIWMFWATLATLSFALAAWALDGVFATGRWPRRWVWVAALIATVVVLLLPSVRSAESAAAASPPAGVVQSAGEPAGPDRALGAWWPVVLESWRIDASRMDMLQLPALLAWGGGSLLLLVLWGAGARALARQRRGWRREDIDGDAVYIARDTGPAVIGLLRPRIVLPEWSLDLPPQERAMMHAHEREHVRGHDPLLLHAATLAVVAMPWNIGAWWLARRLRLAVELDCDSRVLRTMRNARAYGALLVSVGARRSGTRLPVAALALLERPSSLERRIIAMFSIPTRVPRLRMAGALAAALAGVLVACEPPSAEMLGPSGEDEAARTVYGSQSTYAAKGAGALEATVAEYFPEVMAGAGPQTIVFARDAGGTLVLAQRWDAEELSRELRVARAGREVALTREAAAGSRYKTAVGRAGEGVSAEKKAVVAGVRLPDSSAVREVAVERAQFERAVVGGKIRLRRVDGAATGEKSTELSRARIALRSPSKVGSSGKANAVTRVGSPDGLSSIAPDDIESIEVVKYSAGRDGPDPISIIVVTLKH